MFTPTCEQTEGVCIHRAVGAAEAVSGLGCVQERMDPTAGREIKLKSKTSLWLQTYSYKNNKSQLRLNDKPGRKGNHTPLIEPGTSKTINYSKSSCKNIIKE